MEFRKVIVIQPKDDLKWGVVPYISMNFNKPYISFSVNFPLDLFEGILKILNTCQQITGETCKHCGGVMFRSGTCYTCTQCGETSGCG